MNDTIVKSVCRTGYPNERFNRMSVPERIHVVAHGDPSLRVGSYDVQLDTDAAFDYKRKLRGLGWILRPTKQGDVVRESWSDFYLPGMGHNCAEISAMIGGLVRARAEGFRRVLLRTDSTFAAEIVTRLVPARSEHIVKVTGILLPLLANFEAVSVRRTPASELKQVDKVSRTFMRGMHSRQTNEASYYLLESRGDRASAGRPTLAEIAPWHKWHGRFP
jgi:ribonuclease HI